MSSLYLNILLLLLKSLHLSPWWNLSYTYYVGSCTRKLTVAHRTPPFVGKVNSFNCFATHSILRDLDDLNAHAVVWNKKATHIELHLTALGVESAVGCTGYLDEAIEQVEALIRGEAFPLEIDVDPKKE